MARSPRAKREPSPATSLTVGIRPEQEARWPFGRLPQSFRSGGVLVLHATR